MIQRPRPAATEQLWRSEVAARHEMYDQDLEKDKPERPWNRVPHFQGDVQAECKLWARVVRALGEAYARHHWGIEDDGVEFDPDPKQRSRAILLWLCCPIPSSHSRLGGAAGGRAVRCGVCVCAAATKDRSQGTIGFVLLTTKALSKKTKNGKRKVVPPS